MSDPQLLELSLVTFTADQLVVKVRNSSGATLDKRLVIALSPPSYLVNDKISDAAVEAAVSQNPPGAQSLAGIVTGPDGWSVWVRRETSDSSLFIVFINDMDQSGNDLPAAIKFPAAAEFTLHVPLDPGADQNHVDILYSYQHGKEEKGLPVHGKLELESQKSDWSPDVSLTTDHASPTSIAVGSRVKIFWNIKDGVSATLRGPLPGGNSELTLSSKPNADFKIAEGSLEILVVSSLTYVLQAEVKREGHPNVQVVRMLWLDTANNKFSYVDVRPDKVLPHGLVEIDWAAWGVKQVEIAVGSHTTRIIELTQQTLGRFYEGSGVMRVTANKPKSETDSGEAVNLLAQPLKKQTSFITVITWESMTKPDLTGQPLGLAVAAPKLAALNTDGLFIAEVGNFDPDLRLKKLIFKKVSTETPKQWLALTAVDKRFVVLRRTNQDEFEVAPYKADGSADEIPAITLPDLRTLQGPGAVFDLVGFGGRAYVIGELSVLGTGLVRRAFSVGFDSNTKRAEYRPEPLLERIPGYKIVPFDNALYALSRSTGLMFRFDLIAGKLGEPMQAASAVTKSALTGGKEQSMIRQGLIVPVGRVLAVLSPSSVPSLAELEPFGLHNILSYLSTKAQETDPNSIPQDLIYNPQKNYWARCGHDLDIKTGAVAAFRGSARGGGAPRLWVIQPDGETHTLAVGSESLFAHDYVLDFPTKPLPPYLNKKRQFKITSSSMGFLPMGEKYLRANLPNVSSKGLTELISPLIRQSREFDVEFRYNGADPAPITVRYQKPKLMQERQDSDYIVEVTFSGPDLSTITSVFRRIGIDGEGRLFNDEVFESETRHAADAPIEVTVPKQLDPRTSSFRFVIANSAKVDLKSVGLDFSPVYFSAGKAIGIAVDVKTPDAALIFDPRREPNGGVLRLNFNFAMAPGVEVSSGSTPQTKRIRLDPDKSKLLHVTYVGLLGPNDPPLKLEGISEPIPPMPDRLVYVCQISDKP
jgi:hypothetical protein